ncbi:MAG: putative lipid II flippase FtsW [Candidatus Binatia bacterium]|nr:MAG: putative lipid II flippase FtsW [Candidatus Binatia bacterium]
MTTFPSQVRTFVIPRKGRPDPVLLLCTGLLLCVGLVMVFDATYFYSAERTGNPFWLFFKQLAAACVGLGVFLFFLELPASTLERWAPVGLLLASVLLLLVWSPELGEARHGARRWIAVRGKVTLQPVEFVKVALVCYLARSIARKGERIRSFSRGILPPTIVVAVLSACLIAQPDYGNAALLWVLLLAMLFAGGARLSHLAALGGSAGVGLGAVLVMAPYRTARLLSFLDPWDDVTRTDFQLVQSFLAFGSGGLYGNGLGSGRQRFFLPEVHTDFLFALLGEETGLVGAFLVLGLFLLLALRGFRTSLRHPTPFGGMLAFGVTVGFFSNVLVNLGVVLGLIPTKGLPLPLMSYGGSALVGTLAQLGMLGALSRSTG